MLLGRLWVGTRPVVAVRLIAICGVAGFVFGVAAHLFLFNYSEAVTVIEIGHVTTGDKIDGESLVNLEPVDNLSERIRGRTFNAEVAKRTGNKDAEQILSGFRYGGNAGVSTRSIWSNNQLEIRVRAKDDATASALARGVADTVLAEHQAIYDKLIATVADRLKALHQWVDIALKNQRTIYQKISEASQGDANFAVLLVASQQVDLEIARKTAILADASGDLIPPNSVPTRIISTPAIQPRILGSALSMGAVGLVAGLCLAVVILLLNPRNRAVETEA